MQLCYLDEAHLYVIHLVHKSLELNRKTIFRPYSLTLR
jgi:hypothetical protein